MPTIHIVSHTHWDREWYKPFQHFRTKLVFVIDHLISILQTDDAFQSFLLDGQTIVLDDYLQIKPENETILKQLISSGKLVVGPWYIQPDEFAPDGESLIRNLQIGITAANQFGQSMMIGYLPDSFGQSAQMPQILQGFGINAAVMMRGFPANEVKSSEFLWQGINGAEVFGVFLPEGYSNFMYWPTSLTRAKIRMLDVVRKLKKYASTDQFLIMNGVDHQFAQPHIPAHIHSMNHGRTKYLHSTLQTYMDAVKAQQPKLPILTGDLLSPIKNRVHSSMASTRLPQKQKNRKMEALLQKYVEPVCTIAWLFNAEYPSALINEAWKLLIQNQTHDGICGCCTDQVHREMDQRFSDVQSIGETLYKTYTRAIARRTEKNACSLTVFNNALTQGKQLVQATLFTKQKQFTIKDSQGRLIPYQIDAIEAVDLSQASMWTLYLGITEEAYKIDFTFEHEFQFNAGYQVFDILEGKQPPAIANTQQTDQQCFENSFYHMQIMENGSLTLLDKESAQTYHNLHTFEDVGDAGDTYNFSPVTLDTIITSKSVPATVSLIESGPIKTIFLIQMELEVPEKLSTGDQSRSQNCKKLPISTKITCYTNQKRIDFQTTIDNTVLDHRLRVLFPVGINTETSHAETQFGSIQRPLVLNTENWQKEKWSEKPLPIYAMQKFVAVCNEEQGLAILNRGLSEYEIYQPQSAVIAITLIRGVGMMGKGNLAIRPGRASGIPIATPDAQCPGQHVFEYALLPFAGDMDQAGIASQATIYDAAPSATQSIFKLEEICKKFGPMLGFIDFETLTSHVHHQIQLPTQSDFQLFSLSSPHLIISAIKKAEHENAVIVRLYNSNASLIQHAEIKVGIPIDQCFQTSFLEENIAPLPNSGNGTCTLPDIRPYTALTIKMTLPQKH
ncbi:MAG: hypothetical protein JEZ00_15125 [Anaerolineaceae bacterium]|nr:hypothetical protein [Anaerolineaceae bacterium]